jgi:putative Ca2+/H+ antiporter (TMEM165/GDT1 family)
MLAANVPAVFLGDKLVEKISLKYIRWTAAALFVGLGLWMLATLI